MFCFVFLLKWNNIQGQALVAFSPGECKNKERDRPRAEGSGTSVEHSSLLPLHWDRTLSGSSRKLSAVGRVSSVGCEPPALRVQTGRRWCSKCLHLFSLPPSWVFHLPCHHPANNTCDLVCCCWFCWWKGRAVIVEVSDFDQYSWCF